MLIKIFFIYDSKSAAYVRPIFAKNTDEATRTFAVMCADQNSEYHNHAPDYSLFDIGTFDDNTGVVESNVAPSLVISASAAQSLYRERYSQPPQVGGMLQ